MIVPEKRNTGLAARRIVLLQGAADRLGQAVVAKALGISVRALRYKLSVARGVTDGNLRDAATALERDGQIALNAAAALRLVLA